MIQIEDWGLIDYKLAQEKQWDLVEAVSQGVPERIVFCSHPPVVTLGRSSQAASDLQGWQGQVCETNRGGRATYHGPNQLVVYPIVNLSRPGDMQSRDIGAFLRSLENLIIESLKEFDLQAQSKATDDLVKDDRSFTGVWVENRKIASIGIAVKKWITHHGVAINLRPDPLAFQGISPCGFSRKVMTDLETEIGRSVDRAQVVNAITKNLNSYFPYSAVGRYSHLSV